MTVGETWGVTPETASLYSDAMRRELSMVFQFEHVTLVWDPVHGKWRPRALDFIALKNIFSKWQTELRGRGWNSLFWSNHDLPRAVSKYGDDGRYRVESAKMLATVLHFMQGTPYIYQGEEIGMTNARFEELEDYRDVETLNFYKEKLEEGFTHEEMMEAIKENGRDNARTPMQWSAGEQAGFTTGEPWIRVAPNYREINVEAAMADPASIFHYYRRLIALRKAHPVIVQGSFELLEPGHPEVFAYLRTDESESLLVVCNFFGKEAAFELPEGLSLANGSVLISNYGELPEGVQGSLALRPYEAFVVKM
jgi:glycosidase